MTKRKKNTLSVHISPAVLLSSTQPTITNYLCSDCVLAKKKEKQNIPWENAKKEEELVNMCNKPTAAVSECLVRPLLIRVD
jgi:hypothetical protein